MNITIECELRVKDGVCTFKCNGVEVFSNVAHHLEQWQRSMVSETLKAFGEANQKLGEKLAR